MIEVNNTLRSHLKKERQSTVIIMITQAGFTEMMISNADPDLKNQLFRIFLRV